MDAQEPQPHVDPDPKFITTINTAIARAPAETLIAYVGLDALSIFSIFTLLMQTHSSLGFDVPADFALAFALARLLRKVRLPVDIAVAAGISRIYPPLTRVRISTLWAPRGDAPAVTSAQGSSSWVSATAARAGEVVDKYGLAFLLSQRVFVGLPVVFALYAALRAGVDVQHMLDGMNLGALTTSVTGAAGVWAVSACAAAALYPGVIMGAAHLGLRARALRARFV